MNIIGPMSDSNLREMIMKFVKSQALVVLFLLLSSIAGSVHANTSVNLSNVDPSQTSANIGDLIVAHIVIQTDNPFGLAVAQAKITTSTVGSNGPFDTTP